MWSKQLFKVFGLSVLASGTCMAIHFARKKEIFGKRKENLSKNNSQQSKDDVSEKIFVEKEEQADNKTISEEQPQEIKPEENSKLSNTEEKELEKNKTSTDKTNIKVEKESQTINSKVEINNSNDQVETQRISDNKDEEKNTSPLINKKIESLDKNNEDKTSFYQFIVKESCNKDNVSDCFNNEDIYQKYALDIYRTDTETPVEIMNIKIYSYTTSWSNLQELENEKLFEDDQKYLLEIPKKDEEKLTKAKEQNLNIDLTWNIDRVTKISVDSLQKITLTKNK